MATLALPVVRPVETVGEREGALPDALRSGNHRGIGRGGHLLNGGPASQPGASAGRPFDWIAPPTSGRRPDDPFALPSGQDDLAMMTRTFNAMAARMQEREALLQAALRRERAIASTLQTAFLPQCLPHCPGYAFAASYHPALQEAEVGGDFYDLFRLPGDRIGLLMGDVSGKGLAAATHATMARYTVRAYALQTASPGEVLDRVNKALCESIDDPAIFVTACYAALDPATDTLHYAAAGHWPALLARRQGTEMVGSRSLALGISSEATYEEERLALDPGDSFLLYTDGLVEIGAEDPMRHLEAVRRTLKRRRGQTPERLVKQLYQDALRRASGVLRDDVALLAVRRTGP
jgi:serine phosphatase RsbU (regulator of sigma subunit)